MTLHVPMRYICLTAALVFLLGCSKDSDFIPVYDVPEEVQPFIEAFINEAANRGVSIEITNLIIKYDETMESPRCGTCNSISRDHAVQKIISVNPNIKCWYVDAEKEAFFFHELGHCILGRAHDNSLLPNGDPKSMMVENNISIYAPCVYPIGDELCNFTFKRPYYLDELFNESTPVPEWGK